MKKRNFYYLLSLLRCKLESAELDEALKSDHLFSIACDCMFDAFNAEYVEAQIEHRLAQKKVRLLEKRIKQIEKIQNE